MEHIYLQEKVLCSCSRRFTIANPGRGNSRGSRGSGRGTSRSTRSSGSRYSTITKKGLIGALANHVLDIGENNSFDNNKKTWEKLVQYAGSNVGSEVAAELESGKKWKLNPPEHSEDNKNNHIAEEALRKEAQARLAGAIAQKINVIETMIASDPTNLDLPIELAELGIKLQETRALVALDKDITLHGTEKETWEALQKKY